MDTTQIVATLQEGLMVAIKLGGPLLILSMVMGILVAIFQAVTQIHEQSLSFILKLIIVMLIFLLAGGWMMATLQDYTRGLFTLMTG